ncbi:MAG: hypothetical protein JXR95_06735 [Deltaproteobacteria bacterium]|nr:hypothetical protein [Deltaproteobacteria bacterium]
MKFIFYYISITLVFTSCVSDVKHQQKKNNTGYTKPSGDFKFRQISCGGYHTCGVRKDKSAWCWGAGNDGRLGYGEERNVMNPIQVKELEKNIYSVSAGYSHSCALTELGEVFCWGCGRDGQLGNDSFLTQLVPVRVMFSDNTAVSLSLGEYHSCSLKKDGTIWCWGKNNFGQTGCEECTCKTPEKVNTSGKRMISVASGSRHTCAVSVEGKVLCWGDNSASQLGTKDPKKTNTPVEVTGIPGKIVSIEVGEYHSCAKTESGNLWCWGTMKHRTSMIVKMTQPTIIKESKNVSLISSGYNHQCSIINNRLMCFGLNNYGQLGNKSTVDSSNPVEVNLPKKHIKSISCGKYHTCAVYNNGKTWCWGYNQDGQLGNGSTQNTDTPSQVMIENVIRKN